MNTMTHQPNKTCRFFEFGTAPQAGALGYYLAKTECGTEQEMQEKFADQDVILVCGASLAWQPGGFEYAVFVPAPRYRVLGLHKTIGWYQKAIDAGLWPRGDKGQLSECIWIIQDAKVNRITLTQHKLRDLPLDTSGFDASQHAIAAELARLGLLERIDAVSQQEFDPSASFENPRQAIDQILQQPDPHQALMAVVETNVRAGETGFASELIAEYGRT
ncbi:hypothetical protein RQP54_18290 [Curvibacter sp. APW13]|uniref:hypothetical protein n=1 Tax=Curvibacter sp. APW13 TaxID=3077236 RepID=UPI0028DE15C8|nr:hypothetical protein [Curvibacter sp. APW13]MDT8992829.1 hypothetical protein [Curvibacter sp. APW13]